MRFWDIAMISLQTWYELLSNLSLFCNVGCGKIEMEE